MIVEGRTNHNFRKLMTSAPIFGTTKLSLIERREPKLKSMQSIINPSGKNNFNSLRLIGQIISKIFFRDIIFCELVFKYFDKLRKNQ